MVVKYKCLADYNEAEELYQLFTINYNHICNTVYNKQAFNFVILLAALWLRKKFNKITGIASNFY